MVFLELAAVVVGREGNLVQAMHPAVAEGGRQLTAQTEALGAAGLRQAALARGAAAQTAAAAPNPTPCCRPGSTAGCRWAAASQ
eukprot:364938-Chlamydomonas_euryale.AAC.1